MSAYMVSMKKGGKTIGKIRIRCQIGDVHSQCTRYIIEAATAYNLLLGGPRIHENCIVPCTLHQCFKHVGEDLKVHHQFAYKNPFYGLEAHYADTTLMHLLEEGDIARERKY